MRLQSKLKPLTRKHSETNIQLLKARQDLQDAQESLKLNLFDPAAINMVKTKTDLVVQLSQIEENILMQKAKLDWMRLGDNNNAYFHAIIREKTNRRGF